MVPRYGNYAEPQDTGIIRRYKVDGQVCIGFLNKKYVEIVGDLTFQHVHFQDMEVKYFQTYIDGVDFVFIDSPIFQHIEKNIYGGNRLVM